MLSVMLVAAQGLSSLAGATLCLHADGGFCVEQHAFGRCSHHQQSAKADGCCPAAHPEQPATESTIGNPPCDCTHLAIADDPQISVKPGGDDNSRHLSLGAIAVQWIAYAPAAPTTAAYESADRSGAGFSAALSFLAPVMLRC